ncbi:hypothetical protein HELRODRAFT_176451 [Helobdella robusta]|uniref:Uncharacterized protein n=1 Tax=Helobdella robusta TaxID=6412 RepID=T1FAI5_HELRO|nr:hypothetical protein HELRODRAFT_176451 [Helobdella robusta]ESN99690.1 hypothetical protein HELRODRAFT_176451 [Helobdella robusta]
MFKSLAKEKHYIKSESVSPSSYDTNGRHLKNNLVTVENSKPEVIHVVNSSNATNNNNKSNCSGQVLKNISLNDLHSIQLPVSVETDGSTEMEFSINMPLNLFINRCNFGFYKELIDIRVEQANHNNMQQNQKLIMANLLSSTLANQLKEISQNRNIMDTHFDVEAKLKVIKSN